MKKFLLPLFLFSMAFFNAQGVLYLQNYSGYDLQMRLIAQHVSNCTPEVVGSVSFPANTQEVFNAYINFPPYLMGGFGVLLPGASSGISQPAGSGLLQSLSPITKWKYAWFQTKYAGTTNNTNDIDFNMADPSNLPCSFSGTDYVDGALTDAFWFTIPSMNATYLVIQ